MYEFLFLFNFYVIFLSVFLFFIFFFFHWLNLQGCFSIFFFLLWSVQNLVPALCCKTVAPVVNVLQRGAAGSYE